VTSCGKPLLAPLSGANVTRGTARIEPLVFNTAVWTGEDMDQPAAARAATSSPGKAVSG